MAINGLIKPETEIYIFLMDFFPSPTHRHHGTTAKNNFFYRGDQVQIENFSKIPKHPSRSVAKNKNISFFQ